MVSVEPFFFLFKLRNWARGDATGVSDVGLWSKGVRKTWVVSKSSGKARDFNIRSRSLLVRRLSFARLEKIRYRVTVRKG